jgi:hypothetical protein
MKGPLQTEDRVSASPDDILNPSLQPLILHVPPPMRSRPAISTCLGSQSAATPICEIYSYMALERPCLRFRGATPLGRVAQGHDRTRRPSQCDRRCASEQVGARGLGSLAQGGGIRPRLLCSRLGGSARVSADTAECLQEGSCRWPDSRTAFRKPGLFATAQACHPQRGGGYDLR